MWNPDVPNPIDLRAGWLDSPTVDEADNGFKLQWASFLHHVAADELFRGCSTQVSSGSNSSSLP